MNRMQISNLQQHRDHIYAKIRYHQAIGALDKENLTWLPVSPLGWLRGTATRLPIFNGEVWEKQKVRVLGLFSYPHQGLEGPI